MNKPKKLTRWINENVGEWVQAFAALAIAAMLATQVYSHHLQKKDFLHRNRPFLYFAIDKMSTVKKGESAPADVLFNVEIHNYSTVPAFQVTHQVYAVVDGTPYFGIPSKIKGKNENNTLSPGETAHFTFSVPREKLNSMLSANGKDRSVIILRTDYAGPRDKDGERPYFFQKSDLPWTSAKNAARYKLKKITFK